MVPIHEAYYSNLNGRLNNMFLHAEYEFNELALAMNVPIAGSFNPVEFNLHHRDFYDRFHCSKGALKRIYKLN